MRATSLVALVLVAGVTGCDGMTSVRGKVLDPAGKPVPDASVKLTRLGGDPATARSSSDTTDASGDFSVGFTHAPTSGESLLEVSKEGFKTHTEKITTSGSQEKNITLQKK